MKEMLKAGGIALLMLLAIVLYSLLPEEQQVLERMVRLESGSERNEDDEATSQTAEHDEQDSEHALRLTEEKQRQAGIRLAHPQAMQLNHETLAYGHVVDILPLLELKADYNKARAEHKVIQTTLKTESASVKRLRQLLKEQTSVPGSQLREAQARLAYQQARLDAVRQAMQDLRLQMRQSWGQSISEMLLSDKSETLAGLLSGRTVLLHILLPVGTHLTEGITTIAVGSSIKRQTASEATLLSAAVRSDPVQQGETWYFIAPADHYRIGMRINAWLPEAGPARTGLLVPDEAVLWYAGTPWVYARVDGELFVREALIDYRPIEGGVFVEQGFSTQDEIVISGGQMLLSEEFRWQIPEEDDDDD